MTVEDYQKIDSHFSKSMFLANANHMIKKILNSITLNELEKVDHFISDSVYQKFKGQLEEPLKRNAKLVYDQVNVQSEIESIRKTVDSYQIDVVATCKYCKYFTDSLGNVIGGSPTNRMLIRHLVTFQKKIGAEKENTSRCLGCGASINILESGKCPNCGRIYDLEKFDFVITNFG